MSFDPDRLAELLVAHGFLWRVVILSAAGSVPRGAGTAMWVWGTDANGGQEGTIGGGRLEWEAAALARAGHMGAHRLALGPSLGQCCGGSVTVFLSRWSEDDGPILHEGACAYGPSATQPPAPGPMPRLEGNTVIEALRRPGAPLYIWGAGHVGRALVDVLHPIPELSIHWVDLAAKFPDNLPHRVTAIPTDRPETLAAHVPHDSRNLIVTHSHDTDLALCHALLERKVEQIGLIGSGTKWARFRSRLGRMGHCHDEIRAIRCPIGDPALGKRPQAIAIGVSAEILRDMQSDAA